jgi:hypothetical protein
MAEHHAVLMARNDQPPDTFTTPIRENAPSTEIEAHWKALDNVGIKEAAEQKFRLEQHTANLLTQYHQRKIQSRLAVGVPSRTLDIQISDNVAPESSRTAAGRPTTSACDWRRLPSY